MHVCFEIFLLQYPFQVSVICDIFCCKAAVCIGNAAVSKESENGLDTELFSMCSICSG